MLASLCRSVLNARYMRNQMIQPQASPNPVRILPPEYHTPGRPFLHPCPTRMDLGYGRESSSVPSFGESCSSVVGTSLVRPYTHVPPCSRPEPSPVPASQKFPARQAWGDVCPRTRTRRNGSCGTTESRSGSTLRCGRALMTL